jgi:hypothetical protein
MYCSSSTFTPTFVHAAVFTVEVPKVLRLVCVVPLPTL